MAEGQPTPEQIAAHQEMLKNMSPEELREYQKKQCIFCHIIEGKVQSRKVYEDDKVVAILDINPANPGHILLLPREHYSIMPQLPEEIIDHMAKIAKQLSGSAIKAIKAEGTSIIIANGVAAGQRAQHFMIHVIPRMENDGIGLVFTPQPVAKGDLTKIKTAITPGIEKVFGEGTIAKQDTPQSSEEPASSDAQKQTEESTKEPEPTSKKDSKLDDDQASEKESAVDDSEDTVANELDAITENLGLGPTPQFTPVEQEAEFTDLEDALDDGSDESEKEDQETVSKKKTPKKTKKAVKKKAKKKTKKKAKKKEPEEKSENDVEKDDLDDSEDEEYDSTLDDISSLLMGM